MSIQPRFANGVYRDCKWCKGSGCVYCEAEADKEYERQFPGGAQPIATFKTKDIEGGALGLFKSILSPQAVMAAKDEGRKLAEKYAAANPTVIELVGRSKEDCIEVIAQQMTGLVIEENIKKLAKQNPKARKFINKKLLKDKK